MHRIARQKLRHTTRIPAIEYDGASESASGLCGKRISHGQSTCVQRDVTQNATVSTVAGSQICSLPVTGLHNIAGSLEAAGKMLIHVMYADAPLAMFVRLSWRPIDDGVVVVTAPQCGQTAPPCRNAEAESIPRPASVLPVLGGATHRWLAAGLCPPFHHCCRLSAAIVLCCVF